MKGIILNDDINFILKILQEHGKGYVVGGYIRDFLLGMEPNDCDFCTDIEYDKLLEIFSSYNVKEIGKSFGIVQVKYNNKHYEIAKLRKDVQFDKNRKNTLISYVENINDDLKRRDFTVNALAYDGKELIAVTPESFTDIDDKIIRFIGNPGIRIIEDSLRILRGIRLLSEKDFNSIEEKSLIAMKKNNYLLELLSVERIRNEFQRIILGVNFNSALKILNYISFLKVKFNEEIDYNLLPKDLFIRYFFLFYDIGYYKLFELKLSKKNVDNLKLLQRFFNSINEITDINSKNRKIIKEELAKLNPELLKKLIKILKIKSNFLNLYSNTTIKEFIISIIKSEEPIFEKELDISGKDLIELGIINKDIGKLLKKILIEDLSVGRNNKEYLISLVKKYK